ncbi:MAG: hypothetical protein R3C10_23175 [Pirellulales bacterium]
MPVASNFWPRYGNEQLLTLTDMPEVRQLCIDRIAVDEAAREALASLQNLEHLVLWHAPLLEGLVLWQPPIEGNDLSPLASDKKLAGIALVGDFSPAAVASLADVPQLRHLVYAPTEEDELTPGDVAAVLEVLPRLVQLERVVLGGTHIDAAAIAGVRRAMPYARVESLGEDVSVPTLWGALVGDETATSAD